MFLILLPQVFYFFQLYSSIYRPLFGCIRIPSGPPFFQGVFVFFDFFLQSSNFFFYVSFQLISIIFFVIFLSLQKLLLLIFLVSFIAFIFFLFFITFLLIFFLILRFILFRSSKTVYECNYKPKTIRKYDVSTSIISEELWRTCSLILFPDSWIQILNLN